MNVFILSTGRCGSTTFTKACKHITNYTSEHESRPGLLGDARFDYPPDHIESDNRLSWFLGKLEDRFGDNATYVHLLRNKEATVRSLVKRYEYGILSAYKSGILMGLPKDSSPENVCSDYYDTVNSNIRSFLKNKTRKMEFNLENARTDFEVLWSQIGAEGNRSAALSEWNKAYNASSRIKRKLPGFIQKHLMR